MGKVRDKIKGKVKGAGQGIKKALPFGKSKGKGKDKEGGEEDTNGKNDAESTTSKKLGNGKSPLRHLFLIRAKLKLLVISVQKITNISNPYKILF